MTERLTLMLPDLSSSVTSHTGHFDPHIIFGILRLRKFVQEKNFCVITKGIIKLMIVINANAFFVCASSQKLNI